MLSDRYRVPYPAEKLRVVESSQEFLPSQASAAKRPETSANVIAHRRCGPPALLLVSCLIGARSDYLRLRG